MPQNTHWVGTWTTTPAPAEAAAFSNQTLRMIAHVSLGGSRLRVRLSNAYGTAKLAIGAVHIGLHAGAASIVPGSDRVVTFGGEGSATIAAGSLLISDPIAFDLPPLSNVAISIHLPGNIPATFQVTGRYARQTNYISPPGDFSATTIMPIGKITDEWYFVSGIDVAATAETGGVVALGDSLTDANISTPDVNCRWPDQLARRLHARAGGRPMGVMNQGLGGNRILHDVRGDSGLRRFDRDVLAQPGVTHVIICLGINDIRNRWGKPEEVVNPAGMIAGLKQMALRAHTRGIKIFGGTLTPFENETFLVGAYTPAGEATRQAVNAWIRTSGAFDAVIDFEEGLRDPSHPTRMLPIYDCDDHLHPSDLGYHRMGDIINLSLFD